MNFTDKDFIEFLGDRSGANLMYDSPKTGLKIKPATYFKDHAPPGSSKYLALMTREKKKFALGTDKKFDPDSPFGKWLKAKKGKSSEKSTAENIKDSA